MITINSVYTGLVELMKDKKEADRSCLATVTQSNPLQIKIGELELDQDDLLLSDSIEKMQQGDILLLYPTPNKQSYIAICKVVKP